MAAPGAALVLKAIRNGTFAGNEQLVEHFTSLIGSRDYALIAIHRAVLALKSAGFVEDDDQGGGRAALRVTDLWLRVQSTLNIRLSALAALDEKNSIVANPFHGTPAEDDLVDLFVAMPFDTPFDSVYESIVKAGANFTIKRADARLTSTDIMRDVWSGICGARGVIADCTGGNPNVMCVFR